jgi:mannose-6-phosphate isomerase-like protein (cupin superfamily)
MYNRYKTKMELNLKPDSDKQQVFQEVKNFLEKNDFKIINCDESRPWGGFYVIDESQSQKFIDHFFSDVPQANQQSFGKISPKILIVESSKRLSWQYHHRRAEVWKVIAGEVGVVISDTDKETSLQTKKVNDIIILKQGERHRLIGTNQWGIIAEIWQHTDINNPSNEEDIVRVQDDFGR